jgi:BirA family transcriptional regulator, biotin operon repressor / biotin---[acetyl-CoA-carboxylase] ligase
MRMITLGETFVQLQSVDSTNNYASLLLQKEKVAEGTVILAVHQSNGRGQGGNQWVSDKGLNLLFSIILQPDFLPAYKQFYLSMSVAVGIQHYISGLGIPALIKWPNDILISGRKIAGVLIENTILSQNLNTSIIGIGVNVNQCIFPPGLQNPTSLLLETGQPFDLSESLRRLLLSLQFHINHLYLDNLGEIKSDYLNRLWLMNTPAIFTDKTGRFNGRIVDISETGELLVMKTDGECKTYGFKEVVFQKQD